MSTIISWCSDRSLCGRRFNVIRPVRGKCAIVGWVFAPRGQQRCLGFGGEMTGLSRFGGWKRGGRLQRDFWRGNGRLVVGDWSGWWCWIGFKLCGSRFGQHGELGSNFLISRLGSLTDWADSGGYCLPWCGGLNVHAFICEKTFPGVNICVNEEMVRRRILEIWLRNARCPSLQRGRDIKLAIDVKHVVVPDHSMASDWVFVKRRPVVDKFFAVIEGVVPEVQVAIPGDHITIVAVSVGVCKTLIMRFELAGVQFFR
jgi:hypothetical protein